VLQGSLIPLLTLFEIFFSLTTKAAIREKEYFATEDTEVTEKNQKIS